jgi:hypothetical protein
LKRSRSQNLFELEGLEPRILLSGDSLLAGMPIGMSDKPDPLFATDPGLSPLEEVHLSDEDYAQETSPRHADPYNPADKLDDLFAGLTGEALSFEGSEEVIQEEAQEPDPVTVETHEVVLENSQITAEEEAALKQGLEDLAHFGGLLEDSGAFAAHLPLQRRLITCVTFMHAREYRLGSSALQLGTPGMSGRLVRASRNCESITAPVTGYILLCADEK